MVAPQHAGLSITRQCRLVSITRSSFYYASRGDSLLNLRLMRRIDEQFLETPFYGSRQMTRWLRRQGDMVSRKRVRRLMRLLGASFPWLIARGEYRHEGHIQAERIAQRATLRPEVQQGVRRRQGENSQDERATRA